MHHRRCHQDHCDIPQIANSVEDLRTCAAGHLWTHAVTLRMAHAERRSGQLDSILHPPQAQKPLRHQNRRSRHCHYLLELVRELFDVAAFSQ